MPSSRKRLTLVLALVLALILVVAALIKSGLAARLFVSSPKSDVVIEEKPALAPQTVASAPPTEATKAPVQLDPDELKKLSIVGEILESGNDNDTRIDRELKTLSPRLRNALKEKYLHLAAEKRNQRGTVVFLLGRDLSSKEDLEFMAAVLSEPSCQSLQDCHQPPRPSHDADALTGTDVTLAYPQIIAIKSLENFLEHETAGGNRKAALDTLARAKLSDNPRVSSWAQKTLDRFSH